jgi:hypothetical protein
MNMIERFFGTPLEVQTLLVDAARARREEMGLSREEIDELCSLGRNEVYPRCFEYEEDPSCLTCETFSLVAAALRLQISDILEVNLDGRAMQEVIEDMKRREIDVVAAVGGDVADITDQQKARVYVLLQMMHELPCPAPTP